MHFAFRQILAMEDAAGAGLAVVAAALLVALLATRAQRARAQAALRESEKSVARERERQSTLERDLTAERMRIVPLTEGHQHLLASLARGFQDIATARDRGALAHALAHTVDRVFDPSQLMVFLSADRDGREFVLAAAGGQRGAPWAEGARLNDAMGRIGLVARRRVTLDRRQFDAEPPTVRDQVAYSEPAEFLVDVAVPVVVGAEVAAIVALGGSTLPLDTTRSGLELLAAYAAAHVRGIDAGARVDRLLNTDPMTGLGSKGWLVAEGSEALFRCRNDGVPAALAVIGIDDFRGYLGRRGHAAGDALIKGVAGAIRSVCSEGVLLARWSGAEFIALLPNATPREGHAFADHVRSAIAGVEWPGADTQPRGRLTLSAGVAFLPASGDSLDELIEAAAESLASARWNGDATHSVAAAALLQEAATQEIVTLSPESGPGPSI